MYTVLAITCHPDDMEIYAAGTLMKCVDRGDRVVVCHLCSGNLGHVVIEPDELAKIRSQEAQKSAAIGGFEYRYGGFDDLDIYDNNKSARDKVVEIIREVEPDFIITHYPDDYMADHVAASKLVFEASFAATVPHYVSKVDRVAQNVPIFYMSSSQGFNFQPTEYVDVTDYMDRKAEMLRCHESQIVWLMDHDNVDLVEEGMIQCRFRGLQCGVKYAEGFVQCLVSGKVRAERMLP